MDIVKAWYQGSHWLKLLYPASWIVSKVARRRFLQRNQCEKYAVPVIVVGNITVGGTGKTPLVIYLAERLMQAGFKPGIVSRGYGGQAPSYPFLVKPDADSREAGDEALMIARRTRCPVVVDPDRSQAVKSLLATHHCNVVLSDDGLQHYALYRDIEIAVLDGERRLGNGRCLPAGPLREPADRLKSVDYIIANGQAQPGEYAMHLVPLEWVNVKHPDQRASAEIFIGQQVHAVAGIGHPERFFATVRALGAKVSAHAFRDHHPFVAQDLTFGDDLPILMTEKDAVKCKAWAPEQAWYLAVAAQLPEAFMQSLLARLGEAHG